MHALAYFLGRKYGDRHITRRDVALVGIAVWLVCLVVTVLYWLSLAISS